MVIYDEEKKKKRRKKTPPLILYILVAHSIFFPLLFLFTVAEIGRKKIDIEVFIIQEKQKKLESGLFVRMFIANIWKIIHM